MVLPITEPWIYIFFVLFFKRDSVANNTSHQEIIETLKKKSQWSESDRS